MPDSSARLKVLVTGVAGFIGGAVARFLADEGIYEVLATGRQPARPPGLPAAIAYHGCDLAALDTLPFSGPLCVVHAAGLASDRATEAALERENGHASRRLFAAVQGQCVCFIYISSASVYAAGLAGPIGEAQAGQGRLSAYGRSKWAAEQALQSLAAQAGVPLVILRPRAVYGPGDRHLLPRLQGLVRGSRLLLPGGMDFYTSLTSISQLCRVVAAVLANPPAAPCTIANVADPEPHHLARTLRLALGAQSGHALQPMPVPIGPLRLMAALWPSGPVTRQALDYLRSPCILQTGRMEELLGKMEGRPM